MAEALGSQKWRERFESKTISFEICAIKSG